MSDISQSFRQVFISQKNSGYLFELIITKVLQANPHFKKYIINFIDVYKGFEVHCRSDKSYILNFFGHFYLFYAYL